MQKAGMFYKNIIIFTTQPLLLLEIEKHFLQILKEEQDVSAGIAAIRTLMEIIRHYNCKFLILAGLSIAIIYWVLLKIGINMH